MRVLECLAIAYLIAAFAVGVVVALGLLSPVLLWERLVKPGVRR